MLPMLQKHTLITAALLATMSLTACGKKKESHTAGNPTVKEAPAETPQTPGQGSDTNGNVGGDLPNPDVPGSDDYNPPIPEPIPDTGTPAKDKDKEKDKEKDKTKDKGTPVKGGKPDKDVKKPAEGKGISQSPPQGNVPPPPAIELPPTKTPVATGPKDVKPVSSQDSSLPAGYRSDDANNIVADSVSKRITGKVNADGLLYTSTSTDQLLNFLRARNEKVDATSRRLNNEAAGSVVSATLSVDKLSGDATVTLKVQEAGAVKVYNLAGALTPDSAATALRKVRAGNKEVSTGTRELDGTIKCVDFDGGCETTFVRARIGSTGSSGIINIVFRQSSSDLYFNLPGEYSKNPEYLIVRDFIRNTIQGIEIDNKIQTATMSSWEVVNGRSGVTLTLKGENKELLAFAGPLLAPEAGAGVNINLSRIAKEQDDSLDLVALQNTKLTYANWISEARMIGNNGLGQVRIALKMRKRGAYPQDQFAVTFMRKIKPIVDLSDENLK